MIGVQPLLFKSATYHKLRKPVLVDGFSSTEFGVQALTLVAYALGPCPYFSVEKYHFPVDAVQQPEMFSNAEHDAPETIAEGSTESN
jgi:hypothetical protein